MKIRNVFLALLTLSLFVVGQSYATTDLERYVVKGVQKYKLDTNGNETVAGNVSVAGTLAVTGASTFTGVINTSASTPYAIYFASTTAAVPAGTPTAVGILAVSTANILYISTSTAAGGWQKVGAQ